LSNNNIDNPKRISSGVDWFGNSNYSYENTEVFLSWDTYIYSLDGTIITGLVLYGEYVEYI